MPTPGDRAERPRRPNLPDYVLDPLERQDPAELLEVARYANQLATWKADQPDAATRHAEHVEVLKEIGEWTPPEDHDGVPEWADPIVVKKPTGDDYEYFYFQWYNPQTGKKENAGIAPAP